MHSLFFWTKLCLFVHNCCVALLYCFFILVHSTLCPFVSTNLLLQPTCCTDGASTPSSIFPATNVLHLRRMCSFPRYFDQRVAATNLLHRWRKYAFFIISCYQRFAPTAHVQLPSLFRPTCCCYQLVAPMAQAATNVLHRWCMYAFFNISCYQRIAPTAQGRTLQYFLPTCCCYQRVAPMVHVRLLQYFLLPTFCTYGARTHSSIFPTNVLLLPKCCTDGASTLSSIFPATNVLHLRHMCN